MTKTTNKELIALQNHNQFSTGISASLQTPFVDPMALFLRDCANDSVVRYI
jgi:hypothetical protein